METASVPVARGDGGTLLPARADGRAVCGRIACGQRARRGRPELDLPRLRAVCDRGRIPALAHGHLPRPRPDVLRHPGPDERSGRGRRGLPADRSGERIDRSRPHPLLAPAAARPGRHRSDVPDDAARLCAGIPPVRMEVRCAERGVPRPLPSAWALPSKGSSGRRRSTKGATATRRGTPSSMGSGRRSSERSRAGSTRRTSTRPDGSGSACVR